MLRTGKNEYPFPLQTCELHAFRPSDFHSFELLECSIEQSSLPQGLITAVQGSSTRSQTRSCRSLSRCWLAFSFRKQKRSTRQQVIE